MNEARTGGAVFRRKGQEFMIPLTKRDVQRDTGFIAERFQPSICHPVRFFLPV